MFRRLGIIVSGFGVAIVGGMLLFLVFDFISLLDTPIGGFADFLNALHGLQYALVVILTVVVIIMPVDWYFFIGGGTAPKAVSIWVPLEIMLFFGLIGLMIGFRSSSRGVKDAIINSYLFVLTFNIILIALIFATYNLFIGRILMAIIEGVYGRNFTMFVVLSVIENGTILAVFSSFVAAILEDKESSGLDSAVCVDGDVCKI